MKYLLPLMMLAAAAWATRSEPRSTFARSLEQTRERGEQQEVPWLNPALAAQVTAVAGSDPHAGPHGAGDPHAASYGDGDPHAGLYGAGDPHAGLHGADEPHAAVYGDGELASGGSCPHVENSELAGGADLTEGDPAAAPHGAGDPHAGTRAPSGAQVPPQGVPRSSAHNGYTVAELHARRSKLAEQAVRVRGVVVKRTDGILGETFLHLQDGTGSAKGEDHDLTVTTTEVFDLGETVELQGLVRVDQDLGLGYRYAVMLTGATHAEMR